MRTIVEIEAELSDAEQEVVTANAAWYAAAEAVQAVVVAEADAQTQKFVEMFCEENK